MKICKKIWLRYQIRRYERFLLEEGMQEAANSGINIQFGLEEKLITNEGSSDIIYLQRNEVEQIDISQILALGTKKHQEEARRYIVYKKMLKRLDR